MKRRILTISKPYVAKIYRGKLTALTQNHEMSVGLICPPNWANTAWEESQSLEPIDVQRLPVVFNGKNHFHFYQGLTAAITRFRPDILNVEEEHYSAVTWQALRIARQLRLPMTFYTWQNIYKTYPWPFSAMERAVFAYCQEAFAGNQEAADVLRAKNYRGRITVVPQMGIDPEQFRFLPLTSTTRRETRQQLRLDPDITWFGFIGRIVEEKGIQNLITALDRITTDKRIGLLIVGDGPYRQTLQTLAARTRRPVVFHNAAPSTHMPSYLYALSILCLPSLTRANWKEQFGRVLIEAMACGTTVLGSSSGEIPRVIGNCGWTFPEGNTQALAETLTEILTQPEEAGIRAMAGVQRVAQHFTHAAVAAQFATAFARL